MVKLSEEIVGKENETKALKMSDIKEEKIPEKPKIEKLYNPGMIVNYSNGIKTIVDRLMDVPNKRVSIIEGDLEKIIGHTKSIEKVSNNNATIAEISNNIRLDVDKFKTAFEPKLMEEIKSYCSKMIDLVKKDVRE